MTPDNPDTKGLQEEMGREVRNVLVIAKLKQQVDEDLAKLKTKAIAGDNIAIRILHYLAAHATSALDEVAHTNFSIVRPLARKSAFWPVLSAPHEKVKEAEKQFFKQIQLDEEPRLFDSDGT